MSNAALRREIHKAARAVVKNWSTSQLQFYVQELDQALANWRTRDESATVYTTGAALAVAMGGIASLHAAMVAAILQNKNAACDVPAIRDQADALLNRLGAMVGKGGES